MKTGFTIKVVKKVYNTLVMLFDVTLFTTVTNATLLLWLL